MEIGLRKEDLEGCARTFPVCITFVVAGRPVELGSQGVKVDLQNKLHMHPPLC